MFSSFTGKFPSGRANFTQIFTLRPLLPAKAAQVCGNKAACRFTSSTSDKSAELGGAERYRRLLVFLETHPFITRKDYSSITGLLKNKALDDLNLLVEKGYLSTIGRGSHKVYVRAEPQEVKSENP